MLREFLWLLNLDYSLVTSDSVVLQSLRHQLLQRLLLFSQREFSLGTPPTPNCAQGHISFNNLSTPLVMIFITITGFVNRHRQVVSERQLSRLLYQ